MKAPTVLLLVACIATSAAAEGPDMRHGMHWQRDFDRIDGDHDGRLAWSEFRNRLREMFFFADLDNDGAVTRDEARRGLARRFDQFDADHDGALELEEFVEGHRTAFEQADLDDDRALSRDEVDAVREEHRRGRRTRED